MCHSSDRWTFWSYRKTQQTPKADEMPRRAEPAKPVAETAAEKDRPTVRERELEDAS